MSVPLPSTSLSGARNRRAPLVEIFHSIQGEGRFTGQPMGFVRVAVCPIRCHYCDTPNSHAARSSFPVGTGTFRSTEQNPVTGERAAALALEVEATSPFTSARLRAVSLTGGEPLVYPGFARDLGEALHRAGVRLHLETAALDPTALIEVLSVVDHLSADWKLPGTLVEGDPREAHLDCIALASASDTCRSIDVKCVLTADTKLAGLTDACKQLSPYRDSIVLVLQPVTPFGAVKERLPAAALAEAVRIVGTAGFEVRVLPQMHKLLGVE